MEGGGRGQGGGVVTDGAIRTGADLWDTLKTSSWNPLLFWDSVQSSASNKCSPLSSGNTTLCGNAGGQNEFLCLMMDSSGVWSVSGLREDLVGGRHALELTVLAPQMNDCPLCSLFLRSL